MNSVSRNIKRLRLSSGMTQDMLAEKMAVTRQAVSNWETGKNQPDIDTIIHLAQVFNTDANEIIYGARPKNGSYKKYQKQYTTRIIIAAVLIVATIIMEITYVPYLKEQAKYFRGYDCMAIYTLTIRAAFAIAVPTLILSVIALWKDIAISGKIKTVILVISCLLLLFNIVYLVDAILLFRFGIVPQTPHIITVLLSPFFHTIKTLSFLQMYFLPFCAGNLLFFGTAKK